MSAVYPLAKVGLLKGDIDLDGTVKLLAVTSGYTYDETDQFLSDVAGGVRLGTAATLSGKTFTGGAFNASALSYTGTAALDAIAGFIGYVSTGVEATSPLVWFCSTASDQTPLAFTSTGAAIAVSWPFGQIFTL